MIYICLNLYWVVLCLKGGVEGKRQVDEVIDKCASMQVLISGNFCVPQAKLYLILVSLPLPPPRPQRTRTRTQTQINLLPCGTELICFLSNQSYVTTLKFCICWPNTELTWSYCYLSKQYIAPNWWNEEGSIPFLFHGVSGEILLPYLFCCISSYGKRSASACVPWSMQFYWLDESQTGAL